MYLWFYFTGQDTLQLLNAGEEGRAVLLNNYLLALDYETYLALGMAVPDGETVQLLFKDKLHSDTYWLLNSTSGRRTNVKDCTGSMQQIWALVSQDNVLYSSTYFNTNVHSCSVNSITLQWVPEHLTTILDVLKPTLQLELILIVIVVR